MEDIRSRPDRIVTQATFLHHAHLYGVASNGLLNVLLSIESSNQTSSWSMLLKHGLHEFVMNSLVALGEEYGRTKAFEVGVIALRTLHTSSS